MAVWAFGDGDYGKLGAGSSTAKYYPQVSNFNITSWGYSLVLSFTACLILSVHLFRKLNSCATREWRKSVVELSSLWCWPVTDMFTPLDRVGYITFSLFESSHIFQFYLAFFLSSFRAPYWPPGLNAEEQIQPPGGPVSGGPVHRRHCRWLWTRASSVLHWRRLCLGLQQRGTGEPTPSVTHSTHSKISQQFYLLHLCCIGSSLGSDSATQ